MSFEDEVRTISTPDQVATSIGELRFSDGVPSADTARMAFDFIDRARGVEVFLGEVELQSAANR